MDGGGGGGAFFYKRKKKSRRKTVGQDFGMGRWDDGDDGDDYEKVREDGYTDRWMNGLLLLLLLLLRYVW